MTNFLKSIRGRHAWLTCIHEGHGEVDGLLPDGGDGHVYGGHVGLLGPQLGNHTRPLAVLEAAVGAVWLKLELVLELHLLGQCLAHSRSYGLHLESGR